MRPFQSGLLRSAERSGEVPLPPEPSGPDRQPTLKRMCRGFPGPRGALCLRPCVDCKSNGAVIGWLSLATFAREAGVPCARLHGLPPW